MYEKIHEENQKYLDLFKESMKEEGLSEKVIKRHMFNVEFYLNDYLSYYEEPFKMEEGIKKMDYFFSYFFVQKCMWSTGNAIKENISSFKKFYKLMSEKNLISKEEYEYMLELIKESKDVWIEECEEFNSGDDSYFF